MNTRRIGLILSRTDTRRSRSCAGKALVVARNEVGLDLVHGIQRHAHDDHDRRAAPPEWNMELLADYARDDAYDCNVERSTERDPGQHIINVIGSLLSLSHARNESLLFFQIVRHVDRLKGDRGVEMAKENNQEDIERVEGPVAALQHRLQLCHARNLEVGQCGGKHEQRRSEDRRDRPAGIDPQR